MSDKKILDVPYYSQFNDIDDKYWMLRACAVASLKMVLDFHGAKTPKLLELIQTGHKAGGYGPSGWYHDSLIAMAKNYGLEAFREEGMNTENGIQKIIEEIKNGNPVIVSTPKFILDRKKFHMIVITGFEKDENGVLGLFYHDPESTHSLDGENQFVSLETFKKEWRRMAIFIHKK